MAKQISKADPLKLNANRDVICETENLSLEEAIKWLRVGEISLGSCFNDDQIEAISYVTGIDFSKTEKAQRYWFQPGDECLTVKLKNYNRKDKPPFSRAKAEFVLVTFSHQ